MRNVEIFEDPIGHCPLCGIRALTPLPPALLARQTDGTTIVCNPGHGGCNTGFAPDPDQGACLAAAVELGAPVGHALGCDGDHCPHYTCGQPRWCGLCDGEG